MYIDTGEAVPVASPCRPLHGDKKKAIEAELLKRENERRIERCESEWASQIHAVKKPDVYIFVYMDDIIVGSKNHKEHERHLQQMFERLQQTGLVINVGKCVLASLILHFLDTMLTRMEYQYPLTVQMP